MRNLLRALLMVVAMWMAFHGNAVEAGESRTAFRDVRKPLEQPSHTSEQHSPWRWIEYRNRMEYQLSYLSKDIKELNEMAKTVERKLPPELRAKIEYLNSREAFAKQKFMELRSSPLRNWRHLRSQLEKAVDDLKLGIDSARSQFMTFRK
jgi:hypothetical protein